MGNFEIQIYEVVQRTKLIVTEKAEEKDRLELDNESLYIPN